MLIDVPINGWEQSKAIYTKPKQGAQGGWAQLGLAGSGCPLGSILCCHGLAAFSREVLVLLNEREWEHFATGTACLKNVLCDDLVSSGFNIFFMLDFSAGHPS